MKPKAAWQWLVAKAKAEPVAFWGVAATVVLNAVALHFGLSAHVVDLVATGLTLVGIPVVRARVTPAPKAPPK